MSFTAEMSAFCRKEAPDYVDRTVRKTVIEIGTRVVLRSPVGDATYWQSPAPPGYVGGRFRANWAYRFGVAPMTTTENVDPSGSQTVSAIVGAMMGGKTEGIHYIQNSLPYSERLENGWSSQAPSGMVGLTELEFPEIFRRAQA
jgi:hypothetical protein